MRACIWVKYDVSRGWLKLGNRKVPSVIWRRARFPSGVRAGDRLTQMDGKGQSCYLIDNAATETSSVSSWLMTRRRWLVGRPSDARTVHAEPAGCPSGFVTAARRVSWFLQEPLSRTHAAWREGWSFWRQVQDRSLWHLGTLHVRLFGVYNVGLP